ncbi:hypothetical protein BS50DRAFT_671966 [Corynespora cassiicola Philippines]|uniref:L domain-like protein n=1 Tax=Corynespora cassiicola Philippines TaxID=1448308 RepID=A0A2T2P5W3_CORCC|nr:hypothetical protein BS50DRAFT_671966 [Corynespora cassiicola Philippines]
MSQPWLEDLSEEWVDQPTSPPADLDTTQNPPVMQVSHSSPPKLRSRLPRLRHSPGSLSDIQIRPLRPQKPQSAVAARRRSESKLATSPDGSPVAPSRCASQSFSAGDSVVYTGTVAHNSVVRSPTKDHDVPEWKKRLLNGEIGYGDRKDLFSPMGLENIFQKPSGPQSEEKAQPKTRIGLLRGLSAMPSSPPPWPSTINVDESAVDDGDALEPTDVTDVTEDQTRADHSLTDNSRQEYPPEDSSVFQPVESVSVNVTAPNGLEVPRAVSGQTELNEAFSPVFLTTNLKIGDTPKPIPQFRASDLANRLRRYGSIPPNEASEFVSEGNSLINSRNDSSFARLQDDSLPEGLPAGTPDLADVGRFVELRRGGYSRDNSFRTRPLSPSMRSKEVTRSTPETGTVPAKNEAIKDRKEQNQSPVREGLQATELLSPATPQRRDNSKYLSPERPKSSGSPLKLFDAHDTFTFNHIQRRLSQLDSKPEKSSSNDAQKADDATKGAQKPARMSSLEEVSILNESPAQPSQWVPRRVGTFGEGQLNTYQFSGGDFSVFSDDSDNSEGQESAPDESPSMDVAPPGSRQPFRFQVEGSPLSREPSRSKRQGLTRVSNLFRGVTPTRPQEIPEPAVDHQLPQPEAVPEYAEGKRGLTSPVKNRTSKRRRTINGTDAEEDGGLFNEIRPKSAVESGAAKPSMLMMQIQGDLRSQQLNNLAIPEVLARRHILRPRNPTPSQRRREELQAEILEATEAFIQASPKLNTIREQLDSTSLGDVTTEETRAAIVAKEVAAFTIKRKQVVRDETRKRSVTTQDFLDEAVKIMDFIRGKGRPVSGLTSLEETESESPVENRNPLPSSPLTFDKPPSREGKYSTWREPNRHELDPSVMNHLRKFQERETDTFMGSSVNSLRFSHIGDLTEPEDTSIVVEQDDIRITDNYDRFQPTTTAGQEGSNQQYRTTRTHPSIGSSMGNTIGTTASRRSEHVATLAPQAIAHLIPKEVAGMSFDSQKNIWVRQRSSSKEYRPPAEYSITNASEEDPFNNIPDLTVDESAEVKMSKGSPIRLQPTAETFLEETEEPGSVEKDRPVTREGKNFASTETSSAPSKVSGFAWSFPKTETRATSFNDPELRNAGAQKMPHLPTTYAIPESDEDDIEHEIQYYEGRSQMRNSRVRDITISIADRDEPQHQDQTSPERNGQQQSYSHTRQSSPSKKPEWNTIKSTQSLPTVRKTRKPIFADDNELSLLEELPTGNYRMQLSMNLSTGAGHPETSGPTPSSPLKGDATFMLSELPEFTLNQVDECELPDRVVVKHDGTKFSKALEDRYALGTAELVKALQDVEPDEPYWEDLREVDLHEKGLTNLHRLDELCYRLEEMNVSSNSISQVKGIPYSMRRLQAQNNCLTGLTSWTTLQNLQHLDISDNEIDNLDGLAELVHLRTLKVADNHIKSLDGILHLDGLMELSAGGNEIELIDFSRANLKSLTELDLRNNALMEIQELHRLPMLQHLNLDDNCIESFPVVSTAGRCNTLRSLRLCRNGLTSLDVEEYCPKLESLYVDGNSLTQVLGLEYLRHLRTFSARDQMLGTDSVNEKCVGNFLRNPDVRNLYISLNHTLSLDLSQHLLNLQRLELSSMGLKELPSDFGQLTPNIRHINLNFNSLKDLRPLLNIKRLSELLLAGNKLERLRANAMVLGKLTTLSKLDWRDNPLTLRFYAPTSENRILSLRQKPSDEQTTDRFILPDGDSEVDQQYLSRLDYETRIRRRVTEMMLANFCKNLRELDGLQFDKARVLVKDEIWERLLFLGVIQRKTSESSELTE